MKKLLSAILALLIISTSLIFSPAVVASAQTALVNSSGNIVVDRASSTLLGIAPESNVSALLAALSASSGTIRVLDLAEQVVATGTVKTGMKVQLLDATLAIVDNLSVVIFGDVNADGSINAGDLIGIKAHLLKVNLLSGANFKAADLYVSGKVSIGDLLGVKKAILSLGSISQNPKALTVETATDASTLDNLATVGSAFTENFAKNELIADASFSPTHRSIVSGAEAISGNSVKCDYTLGVESAATYFFNTIGKFSASGKYRVTLNYKYLTDTVPTGFYVGINSVSDNSKNTIIDFSGKQKNTVYTFTGDYTLGNYADYFLLWFNISNNDGSKIVIDTLKIERLQSLAASLLNFDTPYVERFTTGSSALSASTKGTIISGTNAIDGESLLITSSSAGFFYFFETNGLMAPNATYKISFKFKVLNNPASTPAFKAGLTLSGGANTVTAIDLSTKKDGQVYQTSDIIIRTANSANYFPSFQLGSVAINLVIDDYTITRIDAPHLADLLVVNKTFTEKFTIGQSILAADSKGTIVTGANAIDGNSLSISSPPGGMFYFFQTLGYMAPNATYKINFKFKILNAPADGALGLPGFYAGLTLSGGGNDVQQIDLLNKTDGNVYQTPDLTFNTGASANYFPSFWINGEQAFNIIIDDYTITRIS